LGISLSRTRIVFPSGATTKLPGETAKRPTAWIALLKTAWC